MDMQTPSIAAFWPEAASTPSPENLDLWEDNFPRLPRRSSSVTSDVYTSANRGNVTLIKISLQLDGSVANMLKELVSL